MAKSKSDRIRDMLKADVAPAAIARKVGVSKSYVYAVKGRDNKKKAAAKRVAKAKERVEALVPEFTAPAPAVVDPLNVQVGGSHYKHMTIQPIQYITANDLGFLEGCIVKRISRWRDKENGIVDLEKIKHEVDLLIASEQGNI